MWGAPGGYLRVWIDGYTFPAHRLIWLHVHACWPTYWIDHINGVRDDNRLANLRDVPPAWNQRKRRPKPGRARRATRHIPDALWAARGHRFRSIAGVGISPRSRRAGGNLP
jgi:hypothetical protein